MQTKLYTPSVNILRDRNASLQYIPTSNGERAFRKISTMFDHGTRSFNIIGAYGTGKSAFILALEKVLNNKANYFFNPFHSKIESFNATYIIGHYSSFKQTFIDLFPASKSKDVFTTFRDSVEREAKSNIGRLLVVDEFGKFLEYAAKENPEEELYFIQQLAELVNNPELPVIFITTLHQPFEDYALELSQAQRKEWEKVRGRLVEISFNEPIEQLLFIASERLVQKAIDCKIDLIDQQELFEAISEADVFPMRDYFTLDFAKKLFPFDILSASLATVAFQRYGQNERSLFSLLESEDYLGLNDFLSGNDYFNVARLYDYLKYNFHSLLNSRLNQDSTNWKALDEALQRAESVFDGDYEDAAKILKTIGLTSILGRQGQKVTKEFIKTYSRIALDINEADSFIDILEEKQIIRFRNYSQRYVLYKGSDFDLNLELELAENQVSKDFSIVQMLQKHFNFPIIPAKRVFYDKGTPRYFIFEISEKPITKEPAGSIDGYINLVFNELLRDDAIPITSRNSGEAILYGWIQDVETIKKLIIEIEKVLLLKSKCVNDQIAMNELDAYLDSLKDKLNSYFNTTFYGEDSIVTWYFKGEQLVFNNSRTLNQKLSDICNEVYYGTPTLKNELMNREKVSGTISSAKNKLIEQLLGYENKLDIGFDENRFPPEKSIYRTLLSNTGIHRQTGDSWSLANPTEKSFQELWNESEKFLSDCAVAPRRIADFIEILRKRPYKLKQGFIDLWVPIFLLAKRQHFALYEDNEFIPALTTDTLEVVMKQPQKYYISTFLLDEVRLNIFNRYRFFLNQIEESSPTTDTFIETVKPFLVFYKRLQPYTKQTKKLSKEALRLREAISTATNPEKIFFEDIPQALGYVLMDFNNNQKLEEFSLALQSATRELSGAFSNLVNRIENIIGKTIRNSDISFPESKLLLQHRIKKLKFDKIDPKLKVLVQRINTPLDERQSWISSIATAIIGKPIDQFTDDDEHTFENLFPRRIHELDNLTDISLKDIDEANEEVLKIELTSFVKGVQRNLIRLPKEKARKIEGKKEEIKKILGSEDKQANIALLIKLLREEIENE